MINFFKRCIVKTATIIEKDRLDETKRIQEIKALEKEKLEKERLLNREFYTSLFNGIREYLQPRIKKLEDQPKELEVGDRVIINKYELKNSSSNAWDLGARSLCGNNYKFNETHHGPIYAEITDIYVDTSLAFEMMEKFLDNLGYTYFGYGEGERIPGLPSSIGKKFTEWLRSRKTYNYNTITDVFGLYVGVKFKLENIDFDPKWGLNINSFLKVDSEEGKKTTEIWNIEEEIYKLKVEYREKKGKLESYKDTII